MGACFGVGVTVGVGSGVGFTVGVGNIAGDIVGVLTAELGVPTIAL